MALCRHHGVKLTQEQVKKLWSFHQLLRLRNRELNMTRIHNFENMVAKHYADSMLVAQKIDLPSPLLDIGTGAGFPAIPLKIIRPELTLLMAEGRKKRAAFLEEALAHLELEGIEVVARKIGPDFNRPVAGVITRALEAVPETLERIKTFIVQGGLALFMKGPDCDAELVVAREKSRHDFELVQDLAYMIPESPHRRRLLVFRRCPVKEERKTEPFTGRVFNLSSPSNKTFASFSRLLSARGIRKTGKAILSGRRIIEEALRDHSPFCRGWIAREDDPSPSGRITRYNLPPPLFRELDLFGTDFPLLLIDVPPIPAWNDAETPQDGCTLFVPFQDPENVGSVIRSAAAFGVSRVVVLKEAAHPFLPKSCRAAGSALLKVPLLTGPSLDDLSLAGMPLFCLSTSGHDIRRFSFPRRFGLLAGMEGPGLPERFQEKNALRIPMESGCESLNAAAAVSVALYAWKNK